VTATSHSQPWSSEWVPRLGAYLASAGASLGIVAGLVELTLGPHIRSWVGSKQDTTRLGLATITLSAIALLAAVTWLLRQDASTGTRLLVVVGLLLPGAICFTTAGRAWYLSGALLVVAAAKAAADLREDVHEALETISRNWLATLTIVLAGFYIFLGATALGLAGVLGVVGGVAILTTLVLASRIPERAKPLVLLAAALPFAALTWWSIVTPLLAILVVAIGWPALRRRVRPSNAPEPLRTPARCQMAGQQAEDAERDDSEGGR
jgi:hypothetical protein